MFKKKIKRNLTSGLIAQLLITILSLFIPRLLMINYGSDYNGLMTSVQQIFTYLLLFEAGLSTVTIQSLYSPLAKNDRELVNSIMASSSIYYKKVGKLYTASILLVALLFPIVMKSTISYFTIFMVLILQGIPNIVNFTFIEKYRLLISADGRTYIKTNISTIFHVVNNLMKILLYIKGYNIILIQLVFCIINVSQLYVLYNFILSKYKWIDLKVKPNFEALKQRSHAFIHQISGLIFSSTDTIVLGAIIGLESVSVYSFYMMLFGIIKTIVSIASSSIYFYLGQVFNNDKTLFYKIHDAYDSFYMSFVFTLYSIAYVFILPFVEIYTKGVNDIKYVDELLPLLFVVIFFLLTARSSSINVINFSQHFKQTKKHSIIEMIINLTISIVLTSIIGIYGVLIGTIIALIYRANITIIYANKVILKKSTKKTYKKWLSNMTIFSIIAILNKYLNIGFESISGILWLLVPVFICFSAMYFLSAVVLDRESFIFIKSYLKGGSD